MIKLSMSKKLKVLKKVKIIDNCWNMPGGGYLNPNTIVEVTSGPTRISDVPFKVIQGSGAITHRRSGREKTTKLIQAGSDGFFFSEGHKTVAPYDYGHLDNNFFEELF